MKKISNNFKEFDFYDSDSIKTELFNISWKYLEEKYPDAQLITSDVYVITVYFPQAETSFDTCIGRTIDKNLPSLYIFDTNELVVFEDFEENKVA